MKTLILAILIYVATACCGGTRQNIPYIREEPGAEDCPAFCDKMAELGKTDPVCLDYLGSVDAGDAGGDAGEISEAAIQECVDWCVNAQKNSVQLNPGCMAKVTNCQQVDCASRIPKTECNDLASACKTD